MVVLDAAVNHHKYIFVDEVRFNLAQTQCRGWKLIGQRATVQVPGQYGGNISMCAAISEESVVGCRPLLESYNAAHVIVFLNEIKQACQGEVVTYVIVWDNVRFQHAEVVQGWFWGPSLTLHLTLLSSTLLSNVFQPGGGRCTITILVSVPPSSWPWMMHATTSMQTNGRLGSVTPNVFTRGA